MVVPNLRSVRLALHLVAWLKPVGYLIDYKVGILLIEPYYLRYPATLVAERSCSGDRRDISLDYLKGISQAEWVVKSGLSVGLLPRFALCLLPVFCTSR